MCARCLSAVVTSQMARSGPVGGIGFNYKLKMIISIFLLVIENDYFNILIVINTIYN